MLDGFESDTTSMAPSVMQPSAIFTEESEDAKNKDGVDVTANSPVMTTVDVDLPGTPAGLSLGHRTTDTSTPSVTDLDGDSNVMIV